jgi:ribosomal protein L11 methyltransferase
MTTVDWHEQWSLFASDFRDGKAHIPLGAATLLLHPGPGFGDLSHPTTQLMIEMLKSHAPDQPIVDIGTGSGILSLAALLLGAPSAVGIDIDPEALAHAKENARLNHLEKKFTATLSLPAKLPPSVFLMNMILPEQKAFGPAKYNTHAKCWITSGILVSQKEEYLLLAKEWGWTPVRELQNGEWMGWVFQIRESDRFNNALRLR